MARTIKQIADEIKKAILGDSKLQELLEFDPNVNFDEQFSPASVESLLIEHFATATGTLESLVEMRKQEVDKIVTAERYGYKGWYERMMRAFQMGYNVNQLEEKTYYDVIDEEAQIIKFAYCEEKSNGAGILIKVAKSDQDGEPVELERTQNNNEYAAARAYINRIKPAGIPVELRSEQSDRLNLKLIVRYNPLLFPSENAMKNQVETGIKNYLKSLNYNGAFVGMRMIDALQIIDGIDIAQILEASVAHAAYPATDITNQASHTPNSGHLVLNTLTITVSNE